MTERSEKRPSAEPRGDARGFVRVAARARDIVHARHERPRVDDLNRACTIQVGGKKIDHAVREILDPVAVCDERKDGHPIRVEAPRSCSRMGSEQRNSNEANEQGSETGDYESR